MIPGFGTGIVVQRRRAGILLAPKLVRSPKACEPGLAGPFFVLPSSESSESDPDDDDDDDDGRGFALPAGFGAAAFYLAASCASLIF